MHAPKHHSLGQGTHLPQYSSSSKTVFTKKTLDVEQMPATPPPSPLMRGAGFSQVIKAVGWGSEALVLPLGSLHPSCTATLQRTHSLPPTPLSGPGNRGLRARRQSLGQAPGLGSLPSALRKQDSPALLPCHLVQQGAPGGGTARNRNSRKLQSHTTHPPDLPPLGG